MKNKLLELREQNNLNQTQMGTIINKSQQFYERYENGKTKLPIELAIKFADYFNVSLDYLCDRPFNNNIGFIPEEKKEVVKLILQLNETNTLKLFGYVSGLLANQN